MSETGKNILEEANQHVTRWYESTSYMIPADVVQRLIQEVERCRKERDELKTFKKMYESTEKDCLKLAKQKEKLESELERVKGECEELEKRDILLKSGNIPRFDE